MARTPKRQPGVEIKDGIKRMMGHHPKRLILNKWNQVWGWHDVFVTDGSCGLSTAKPKPILTYMAIRACAADHAVSEPEKGNLGETLVACGDV